MSSKGSIYKDASLNTNILLGISAIIMIVLSIYLTNHYFAVKFPSSLTEGSICNINQFLNCDKTTLSAAGSILGVPISVFGILIGAFILIGFVYNNEEMEGTLYKVLFLNTIGCLLLFFYSVIILKSLCPFCTLYYIFSIVSFLLFKKYNELNSSFCLKTFGSYTLVTLLTFGITWNSVNAKLEVNNKIAQSLISQYYKLPNLGYPKTQKTFYLNKAAENFEDAPIQVVFFSDFQCPACKALSDITHDLIEKYKDNMNLIYNYYPLDSNCNPGMKRQLHPLACKAAYLTSCNENTFGKVHDDIFNNQNSLSTTWINEYAQKTGTLDCIKDPKTKEIVANHIEQANKFNVRSTPTMLVNGVKIEGVRPIRDYIIIFDEILKRHK